MKIYVCYHTDGDAGWYRVRLFSTREQAEALERRDGSAYFRISELELDAPDSEMDKLLHEGKPVIENVKCPVCQGDMVSRKGQYGTFWGCKSYPNCRGTRDSMGRSKEERENERRKENGDVLSSSSLSERQAENDKFRFRKDG